MRHTIATLLAGLLGLAFGTANAASFDCAKASNRIESAICASPELSKLDEQLAAVYAEVLRDHKAPDAVKASQRAWIKEKRNACADERCMISVYQERIAAFQSDPGFRGAASMTAEDVANEDAAIAAAERELAASSASEAVKTEEASASASQPGASASNAVAPPQPMSASQSEVRKDEPTPNVMDRFGRIIWNGMVVVSGIGLLFAIGAVLFKKITKARAAIVGLTSLVAGVISAVQLEEIAESDFYLKASAIPLTDAIYILPSARDLKFGMPSERLPSGFVQRTKTAELERQEKERERSDGFPVLVCYDNDKPASSRINSETACFDKNRLISVNSIFENRGGFEEMYRTVETEFGRPGTRAQFADKAYEWRREVDGISVLTQVSVVEKGVVYIETLEHLHKANRHKKSETAEGEDTATSTAQGDDGKSDVDQLRHAYVSFDRRCKDSVGSQTAEALLKIDELSKFGGAQQAAAANLARGQLMMLRNIGCAPRN